MFTKKSNFLGGKTDKSPKTTKSTTSSNTDRIRQKQSIEFRKSLAEQQQQHQQNDRRADLSNNESQRAPSVMSSLSHPASMASSKSLHLDLDTNNKKSDEGLVSTPATMLHKQERPITPHAPPPNTQTVSSLTVNTVKPKLLRSSVNNNQVSKITERLNRSLEDNKELKQKLETKRQEAERITKEYLEHLKTIRAVDEDYSTITDKLNALHSRINQFLMNVKGRIADPATATRTFLEVKGWERIEPAVQYLANKKDTPLSITITQLAEKFILEEITKNVYNAPIYIGLPQNGAFVQVSQFMEGYSNWAMRLRQRLCTLTVNIIKESAKDKATYKSIEAAKAQLVARMLNTLSAVYSASVHKEMEARLKSYVEEAAAISLAMHSAPYVVRPLGVIEGKDKVDPERIDLRFGKTAKGDTIQIVICSPFIYAQDGILNVLTKGKVVSF